MGSCTIDGVPFGGDANRHRAAGAAPPVRHDVMDAACDAVTRAVTPVAHEAAVDRAGRRVAREADRISTEPKESQMPDKSNPVDVYVGEQLRRRRTALGITMEALGEASGITYQQVQKYERGKNRVGASRLAQFAVVLQVSPGWFFEGAPAPDAAIDASVAPDQDNPSDILSSREGLRLARAFLKIGDRAVQAKVADLVEVICRAPAQGEAQAA